MKFVLWCFLMFSGAVIGALGHDIGSPLVLTVGILIVAAALCSGVTWIGTPDDYPGQDTGEN